MHLAATKTEWEMIQREFQLNGEVVAIPINDNLFVLEANIFLVPDSARLLGQEIQERLAVMRGVQ